ncbi:hypothetical protein [Bacillus sp. KH172YL63]|uniref:hypothetical protein n=1 Tax=Bacillus sp. KH172YL63 TaxID=2709784 RepID=UPI0013E490C4|nr:hypothetical protein [Bacillus sp. KH172YL63]BCB03027.1 hypothetical protein KH172YL63_11600 [Bacillus sp. KH172YL63]
MNHAFVFAAQQFLGFELCDALLEKGCTVTAVDEDMEVKDKWLEIGRNANLQYIPYEKWDKDLLEDCFVFLPYYDQMREGTVEYLQEVDAMVSKLEQPPQVIRIYQNGTRNHRKDGAAFYIPTLYGVHQPRDFLFAQLLQGGQEGKGYADDPSGAIYVKDAARTIVSHSSRSESFTLKPLSPDSWNEALSYVTDKAVNPVRKGRESVGQEIIVKPSKPHQYIIENQIKGIRLHEIQE